MENQEKSEDVNELKEMMVQNAVEGFLADDAMKSKLMKLLEAIAVPAFMALEKKLGNDELRIVLYRDPQYGIVLHQMKTATTNMEFEEPGKDDIFIITKEQVRDMDKLLSTLMNSIGAKMF